MEYDYDSIIIPPKALNELKEALFIAIGNSAASLSEEDLQKIGKFLLGLQALAIRNGYENRLNRPLHKQE